ncbi:MAG: hypothetical protein ABJR05_11670 [Balneola sp.]
MKEEYENFKNSIKKKHSIRNTPQFEEDFDLGVKKSLFMPMSKRVIEILEWDFLIEDENTIHALVKNEWGSKQRVNISYKSYQQKHVKSESSGNEIWDAGKNSKNVKLFIHVLQQELNKLNEIEKEKIEKEYKQWADWDDYEIPTELPKPKLRKTQKWILYLGSIVSIIFLGIIAGYLDLKKINIPIITEAIIASIFWFIVTRLSKLGNFTDVQKLNYISFTSLALFILIRETSFYLLIKYPWVSFTGFFEFELKYYAPLYNAFPSIEIILYLMIYLVVVLQFVIIFWLTLIGYISVLKAERIPLEVMEFVSYLMIKNKTEKQIRYELSKYGWDSEKDQNVVFDSLGGIKQIQELSKI